MNSNRIRGIICAILFLGLTLTYNACQTSRNFESMLQNGTAVGNPMAPTSMSVLSAVCSTVNRCHPKVALEQCQQGVLNTEGFASVLGLSASYSTLATIVDGEADGQISGNSSATESCSQGIVQLSCSDPAVESAYNPSLSNPFSGTPNLVVHSACQNVFNPGVSLEVPIELLDHGLASSTSASTFERTRTSFNPSDYDGVQTYSFEVVATNTDLLAKNVSLVNSQGAPVVSLSVPAQTLDSSRFRTVFNPQAGADSYRIRLDSTSAVDQLSVYTARLLVRQVSALAEKLCGVS